MNLDYRIIAVVAMVFLCFSTLFTKLAIGEGLTARHTLIVFATFTLIAACTVDIYQGEKFWKIFTFSKGLVLAGIGAFLGAIALLLYYKAIGQGPISTVTPIWSLQSVGVGILGVIFLKEAMTDLKVAAIALCLMAVWFITRQN
jgi:uncharacterized membrane protein